MNNNCWYKLQLENTTTAIRKDWVFPTPPDADYGVWNLSADSIFSDQWLQYLKTLGLPLDRVMLFYRGAGFDRKIAHIDVLPSTGETVKYIAGALNFVLKGNGSNMVWYDIPKVSTKIRFILPNTPFLAWSVSELEEIDRVHIGEELMLVKTSAPHNIEMGNEPRWCISVRSTDNINGDTSWEQLVDHFRSLNLLIER